MSQIPEKPKTCSQPESVKSEPWTAFTEESYSFINEGFSHEKFLTVKTTQKTDNSTIKLKSTLSKKGQALKLADDCKFWFGLKDNKKMYIRYKDDFFKVQYDHGISEYANNRKYNFYGSYQAHKNLLGGCAKIGACYIGETMRCDNRIRVEKFDTKFQGTPEFTFYHKSEYNIKNNWRVQMYGAYNLSKYLLLNNAFLVGYKNNQHELFFRGEVGTWRKNKPQGFGDLFRDFTFNYVKQLDSDSKAGVEVHLFSASGEIKGVTAAYEKVFKEENATVKWRFNSAMNLALSIKRSMGSYGSYNVGFEIADLGRANNIKFGTELSLNL